MIVYIATPEVTLHVEREETDAATAVEAAWESLESGKALDVLFPTWPTPRPVVVSPAVVQWVHSDQATATATEKGEEVDA
jgi:hypothetical protein